MNSTTAARIEDRPSDESASKGWLRALKLAAVVDADPKRTLGLLIAEQAQRRRDAPALIGEDEELSYRELAEQVSRWGRWALSEGVAPGEAVALIMGNRPQYLAAWAGITAVGGVVALINTSLRGSSLIHCLKAANPRHVIVEAELLEIVADALDDKIRLWVYGRDDLVETLSGEPLSAEERRGTSLHDLALLIYTSGTTGLPKAARVSHHRVMMWSHWFCGVMGATQDDRLYDCLPMCHSVGGVVAPGALLCAGGAVLVRKRFSQRRFWCDIVQFECTIFQYIGELCRYLVRAPADPLERRHKLRLACGNGLSAEVWRPFEARFAIPRIVEFYAATEGNFSLYNLEGEPGALGRPPAFLAHRFPLAIVEHDPAIGEPARDGDGRCVRCPPGVPGEAIARLGEAGATGGRFEGYTSEAETKKKVLRDVFARGDAWVRSGDLMRRDARGFYRFVDRIGDTFRWKGENVATTEVAAALAAYPGIEEACVYGVAVPGADGRAGMATLVVGAAFEIAGLAAHLERRLPAYARPLFLRIAPSLAATETFKPQKGALAREGFDAALVDDPLFFHDPRSGAFVPLDASRRADIAAGRVRL
jgi:fatty-acyl-CoA synthase